MIKSEKIGVWLKKNRVINLSGTMTSIGASIINEDAAEAINQCFEVFIDMDALQAKASQCISEIVGSEAGCITACTASGICISIAATMTGMNLGLAEELPDISRVHKSEVVIQKGHVVSYGSNISQKIRLTGAHPVEVGTSNLSSPYQLNNAINESTCAAIWVVSHHTVQSGLIGLQTFIKICRDRNIPVIIDAASEYDLRTFINLGASIVIYSSHKFLGGPTAGILAGNEHLIRSAYMHQTSGLGRAMKVGKESIVGAIAALNRWKNLNHRNGQKLEYARLLKIRNGLASFPELVCEESPDPTGNPITRLRVSVDPIQPSLKIETIAEMLRSRKPSIIVRDHHVDLGYFEIDPCNMIDGDPEIVVDAFEQLRPIISGYNPDVEPNSDYGPQFSYYDEEGFPRINLKKVSFTQPEKADREQKLKSWPNDFLTSESSKSSLSISNRSSQIK
jgi:L-seryl-tRNA(Ser) seleniumtransferase